MPETGRPEAVPGTPRANCQRQADALRRDLDRQPPAGRFPTSLCKNLDLLSRDGPTLFIEQDLTRNRQRKRKRVRKTRFGVDFAPRSPNGLRPEHEELPAVDRLLPGEAEGRSRFPRAGKFQQALDLIEADAPSGSPGSSAIRATRAASAG